MSARQTVQRSAILSYLRRQESHPTAKDVHLGVKAQLPGVSLSTVYRTLGRLRDEGEAIELPGVDGRAHYDGRLARHAHFHCVSCQRLWDVEEELPIFEVREFEQRTGFKVRDQRFDLYGKCSSCHNKEER